MTKRHFTAAYEKDLHDMEMSMHEITALIFTLFIYTMTRGISVFLCISFDFSRTDTFEGFLKQHFVTGDLLVLHSKQPCWAFPVRGKKIVP